MQPSNTPILLFILSIVIYACSNESPVKKEDNHLGEIHFKVTGLEEAQPHFEEGLLLLHSFEFDDARSAFLKAQEIDSNFIMAYWGEAMTFNKPLWRIQDYKDGKAVLDSMDQKAEMFFAEKGTEIEKTFGIH